MFKLWNFFRRTRVLCLFYQPNVAVPLAWLIDWSCIFGISRFRSSCRENGNSGPPPVCAESLPVHPYLAIFRLHCRHRRALLAPSRRVRLLRKTRQGTNHHAVGAFLRSCIFSVSSQLFVIVDTLHFVCDWSIYWSLTRSRRLWYSTEMHCPRKKKSTLIDNSRLDDFFLALSLLFVETVFFQKKTCYASTSWVVWKRGKFQGGKELL